MEVGTDVKRQLDEQSKPEHVPLQQRFEDRFRLAFAEAYKWRNQEADAPRVKVKMFYSLHATREDLSGLIGEFAEREKSQDSIHAYFPEASGWRKEDLDLFRQASFGEISPEELDKRLKEYSSRPAVRKNIKDTHFFHIPIGIIDIPAGHSLEKKSDKAWKYKPPLKGDFSKVLNYTRTFLNNLATRQNERENYMLSQITPEKVEELLEMYPGLVGDKKELNILLSLGLGHAPLPYDYPESSLTDQGIVMSRFGEEINNELAAKIFLDSFMGQLFSTGFGGQLISDSRKLSMYKRKILSQFGYEDAERIFKFIQSYADESGKSIFPRDEFNRMFKEKGLRLPSSEQKLDEFLAKPIPSNKSEKDQAI